jgi:hypothetical protein
MNTEARISLIGILALCLLVAVLYTITGIQTLKSWLTDPSRRSRVARRKLAQRRLNLRRRQSRIGAGETCEYFYQFGLKLLSSKKEKI